MFGLPGLWTVTTMLLNCAFVIYVRRLFILHVIKCVRWKFGTQAHTHRVAAVDSQITAVVQLTSPALACVAVLAAGTRPSRHPTREGVTTHPGASRGTVGVTDGSAGGQFLYHLRLKQIGSRDPNPAAWERGMLQPTPQVYMGWMGSFYIDRNWRRAANSSKQNRNLC